MKKILLSLVIVVILVPASMCFAAKKTYVLFVAPSKFTTEEFLEIATKTLGNDYIVSRKLQDYWTQYCWNMNFLDSEQKIDKEILLDFISRTNLDKIVFVVFKDSKHELVDLGGVFVFWSYIKNYTNRTAIQSRVIIMNRDGEMLKTFEAESKNISPYNERRANRGAFRNLCKNISKGLNLK